MFINKIICHSYCQWMLKQPTILCTYTYILIYIHIHTCILYTHTNWEHRKFTFTFICMCIGWYKNILCLNNGLNLNDSQDSLAFCKKKIIMRERNSSNHLFIVSSIKKKIKTLLFQIIIIVWKFLQFGTSEITRSLYLVLFLYIIWWNKSG